ncbi:MAG: hypothetical protein EBT02_01420 [Planctomycetia bacterium]|nr:hypothetical protein [Planctomycetia bacterium]
MALVLKDRVQETTTTTGTGTLTLGGAVTGYQSFSAIGNANTTYYAIYASGGSEWEVGIGTYTSSGTTLSRDTVLSSSNSGSLVSFSAGTKNVWCDYPAGKAAYQDASGVVTAPTFTASTSVITPIVQASNSGGLSLKNSAGTTQISMGAGGGDNASINVSTNINGTNAQIDISPTGTGHVHINPTGVNSIQINPTYVGTMDNMTIGATTPKNASVVDLSVTGTTSFDGSQGTAGQVLTSAGTGATPTWTTPTTGTVTSVGGTGTVNGLTLTGTVTTSGNLTLGGTLSLASPPAIGGTTPAAITGTTITATQYVGVSGGTF